MANSDPIFSLNNVTPKDNKRETIKFTFPTKMVESLLSSIWRDSRIKHSGPTGGFMSLDCLKHSNICLDSFLDYIHRISVSVSCPDLFKLGSKFIRQPALPIEGNYKRDILDEFPECLFLDLKRTKIKSPHTKNI